MGLSAAPAFSFIPCPLSPHPLPRRGRGRFLVFLCKGLRPLHPRGWTGRGTGCPPPFRLSRGLLFSCWLRWALTLPGGGRGGWGYPPPLPLVCFLAPYPPSPLPRRGRGRFLVFLCKGLRPLHPRGWTRAAPEQGANRALAGVCLRNRQLAAKPIEQPFYWQCRQPRRGGTGGDGTIRRTRRRRLRWSSPPGQVEQMPHGGQGSTPKAGVGRRQRGKTSPPVAAPCKKIFKSP